MEIIYSCFEKDCFHLIRFYNNGTIIAASNLSLSIEFDKIPTWFLKERISNSPWLKGTYKREGAKIVFSLKSNDGIIKFDGELLANNTLRILSDNPNPYVGAQLFYPYPKKVDHSQARIEPISSSITYKTNVHPRVRNNGYLIPILILILMLASCFTCVTRKRIGATCKDGTHSDARGRGACSWHGGVRHWNYKYWWEDDKDYRGD